MALIVVLISVIGCTIGQYKDKTELYSITTQNGENTTTISTIREHTVVSQCLNIQILTITNTEHWVKEVCSHWDPKVFGDLEYSILD